jgi:hypothetical protein
MGFQKKHISDPKTSIFFYRRVSREPPLKIKNFAQLIIGESLGTVANRCERWRIVANGGESLRTMANRCERWRIVANDGESLRTVANRCERWRIVANGRSQLFAMIRSQPFATIRHRSTRFATVRSRSQRFAAVRNGSQPFPTFRNDSPIIFVFYSRKEFY